MRFPLLTAAVCAALALTGCDTAGTSGTSEMALAAPAAAHLDGAVYEARLRPLNPDVNGRGVTGTARFTIEGGTLTATVDARGLAVVPPLGIHPQHIHAGAECPTMEADDNGDRILDVIEGLDYYGNILVSLDADLADLSFQTSFPSARPANGRGDYGVIDYEASTLLSTLTAAIGEDLALETRHVVLHGVAASVDLPETVQSLSSPAGVLPAQLTLPVACGEIRRVR